MVRNTFVPRIEYLILFVTHRCPLECRHCFVDQAPLDGPELTVKEAGRIAQALNPLTWLDIGGGEPFLRRDLVDLVAPFRARQIGIPTNGWFVDETIGTARNLHGRLGNRLLICVSLEGFRNTHDSLRGEGSFDRAMATFQGLQGIDGLRIVVNSTLTSVNHAELPEFMRWMRERKPFAHLVNILRGRPHDPEVVLPPLHEIRQFRDAFLGGSGPSDYGWDGPFARLLSVLSDRYVRQKWMVAMRVLEEGRQVLPCRAGRTSLVVYANGDVAPCELLPPVGNVRSTPLPDILAGPAMAGARKRIRARECHCTHECNMAGNAFLNLFGFLRVMSMREKKRR